MAPLPQDPGAGTDPLPADETPHPGTDAAAAAEAVDAIDKRIREAGSEEVEAADKAADEPVRDADPDDDPTDDGADNDTPA